MQGWCSALVLLPLVPLGEVTWGFVCVISLALVVERYSAIRLGHHSFVHSPVHGYLGCFQFGTVMDPAAVNFHEKQKQEKKTHQNTAEVE